MNESLGKSENRILNQDLQQNLSIHSILKSDYGKAVELAAQLVERRHFVQFMQGWSAEMEFSFFS